MKILLLAGAGTSVELGVPSMPGLAREFLEYSRQWAVEPELVGEIMKKNLDVEHLIEELDRICDSRASLKRIGREVADPPKAERVRTEVDWFVQHAAERIVPDAARLMWGQVLNAAKGCSLTIVTTNYDRAIELAANGEKIELDDGFDSFAGSEIARWIGFGAGGGAATLIKLHGSTDWFVDRTENPLKTRHPMALFGRATLRLEDLELGSALVLPSREKLLNGAPYPRLSQAFLNAADACDVAIVVGSSLRDNHIRNAARELTGRVAVFVVDPNVGAHGVDGAHAIRECASTFLMSTLPNALASERLVDRLMTRVGVGDGGEGILDIVQELRNREAGVRRRCEAAETLHGRRVTLAPVVIREVLDDSDEMVARYGLGLVPYSAACGELIDSARRSRHWAHAAFREEVGVLERVVNVVHGERRIEVGSVRE